MIFMDRHFCFASRVWASLSNWVQHIDRGERPVERAIRNRRSCFALACYCLSFSILLLLKVLFFRFFEEAAKRGYQPRYIA